MPEHGETETEQAMSDTPDKPAILRSVTRRRGDLTIRATWPDGLRMMFGNSYRKWWDQLGEYCRMQNRGRPSIEVANEPWIGFGGLKWCSWEDFQEELDTESAGRVVSDFQFRPPNQIEANCLIATSRD